MIRRGHRGKVDANHASILAAARQLGWSAQSLASIGQGCPDAIVARGNRVLLLELKSSAKAKLTEDEIAWHRDWRGVVHIVRSVGELIDLLAQRGAEGEG